MLNSAIVHKLTHQLADFFLSRELISAGLCGLFMFVGRHERKIDRYAIIMVSVPVAMVVTMFFASLRK